MKIKIYEPAMCCPMGVCRLCGEPSCLAFAVLVWTGETSANLCLPVFENGGTFSYLREPLLEICAGMGIKAGEHG